MSFRVLRTDHLLKQVSESEKKPDAPAKRITQAARLSARVTTARALLSS